MLAVSRDTVRLFLHVLAATIWVGGQLTLAALVPVLRRLGAQIPGAAARRFSQVAWPAFAVLIRTPGRSQRHEGRQSGRTARPGPASRPLPGQGGTAAQWGLAVMVLPLPSAAASRGS